MKDGEVILNIEKKEKYMVHDDTIDVGKEPLPETPETIAVFERVMADIKAGKFNK